MQESHCITCELVARRDTGTAPLWDCIHRSFGWDIVHCNATSLPGWMVLVSRRHVAAIDELTSEEARELGNWIHLVSQALKQVVQCERTYVVQFAEAEGHRHVHFHIIPRMPGLPKEQRGPKIFTYLGVPEQERLSEDEMNNIARGMLRHLHGMLSDDRSLCSL